jgi:DNA-binding CsgD family transcriptional regulator
MVRDGQWTIGTLTRRQMEVVDLLAEGMSTADIATKLWVSRATVRNHVQQILEKLGVHTRLAAVHAADVHVLSPGQRIIDWCRSQRVHLEPWQEMAIRRVFEQQKTAPQAMPTSPAQVTVSTTLHSPVLPPARVANAADGDWGNGEGRWRTATEPADRPDLWIRGSTVHAAQRRSATLLVRPAGRWRCTGCTSKAVVETDK